MICLIVDEMKFEIPCQGNEKLEKVVRNICEHRELEGFMRSANVNAMNRLRYSDHGSTHLKIVANAALKILRILSEEGVTPNLMKDYDFPQEDAEVVVVLGAVLHDIGMAVHREDHDLMSISIAINLLGDLLEGVYGGVKKGILTSEVLGAMFPHDGRSEPLTVEAGILGIADALDMAEGRARIPFESGKIDIHSISAMSITGVEINEGVENEKPVQIKIHMKNNAGLFQVDELLKKKVLASGLEEYFNIVAEIEEEGEEVVRKFEL